MPDSRHLPTVDAVKEARIDAIALDPTAHSVRVARGFASDLVEGHRAEVRETVVLLVSELVSNAVQHGGPHGSAATVELTVEVLAERIRVAVADAGQGDPVITVGRLSRPSGRGLLLVQALASQWGYERSNTGKVVWCEVSTQLGRGDNA